MKQNVSVCFFSLSSFINLQDTQSLDKDSPEDIPRYMGSHGYFHHSFCHSQPCIPNRDYSRRDNSCTLFHFDLGKSACLRLPHDEALICRACAVLRLTIRATLLAVTMARTRHNTTFMIIITID